MNRYLLYAIFIVLCLPCKSQDFHGGLFLGFTASQVDGDSYAGYDKLGLQGGVFISKKLTSNLNARFEIRYASRGARNPASDDNTGAYLLNLNYIDLPLLAEIRIKTYGWIELGLVPGYMFHAGGEVDGGELLLDDFRKFDLGTLMGINVKLTEKMTVNVRYSYSIFTIRDLESAGAYYSWFGKIFGNSRGDFNNYLSMGLNYQLK